MQVTKEDLVAQYQELSNSEILRRAQSGTLTPLAREVAREELRSRGVQFEANDKEKESLIEPDVADPTIEENPTGLGFVTIAHLVNPLRANLLRARLQSEGIVVHVFGEHLGAMHIFLSAGTGGIRVQVRSDQVVRAQEILADFDRIEQTVDEAADQPSDEQREWSDGDNTTHYSTERTSPYAPPKAHVEDVEKAKKRRASLNKPASALFFWILALLALGAVFYLIGTSG
jgi:hypothetical protein